MPGVAQGSTVLHGVTKSVHQDVFTVPLDYALAHCVASEFQMPRGNARVFRSKFGGIGISSTIGPCLGKLSTFSKRLVLSIKI